MLDFAHAAEYVSAMGQAAEEAGSGLTPRWLEERLHQLKHEGPQSVLPELRALQTRHPTVSVLGEELAYLEKREAQRQYLTDQEAGWPIGPGSVESANKLVVEARLKGAGRHGERAHVNAMLVLGKTVCNHPESDLVRALYDCPDVPVGSDGQRCRVVVATHPAEGRKSKVGLTRSGLVYELFFTRLPQSAFTAADVVALYLHRGAFEPALADEDQEQDPDRWCSHLPCGQEAWQIISQWVWNLRLELGHQLLTSPVRTTEFAPALPPPSPHTAPPAGYAPPQVGLPWKVGHQLCMP
jgi:hypothetical protein